MPQNGACNLGSINLSEFVKSPYTGHSQFDFEDFEKTVKIAIRALDEVLDYGANLHALPEQREMAKNYRNIGLGIMGLGSMLFKMGIEYGSDEAVCIVEEIGNKMFRTAVETSVELAKEKGTFPKYKDIIFDSEIMKLHFTDSEIEEMRKYGLRNCSLLSIAPSGSIGTLLNITTGCEPAFRISYKRKTESLHKDKDVYYDVLIKEAQEFKEIYPDKELPSYFVASDNIHWSKRIDMQAALQKHIDTAISSTVNLPNDTTIEEVENLYMYAWEKGLKGVTIFRDGCKRTGILTTDDTKKEEPKKQQIQNELKRGDILCVSDDLLSMKRTIVNGCGKFYLHVDFDESTGEPLETFIDIGSGGGCERNLQFISRLISLALRAGVPLSEIIDQTTSIRPCKAYTDRTAKKKDTSKGTSCPSAIGHALKELQEKINARCFVEDEDLEDIELCSGTCESCSLCDVKEDVKNYYGQAKCPECGESLTFEGGCNVCKNCGWSKCD